MLFLASGKKQIQTVVPEREHAKPAKHIQSTAYRERQSHVDATPSIQNWQSTRMSSWTVTSPLNGCLSFIYSILFYSFLVVECVYSISASFLSGCGCLFPFAWSLIVSKDVCLEVQVTH